METEIKLSPVDAAIASQVFADELLRPYLGDARRSDMESIYYIDKYGLLGKMKAGLRIRQENGEGVCCLKVSRRTEGSAKVREEYEVPAEDITEGVQKLCGLEEMPDELKAVLEGAELSPVCGCSFTRTEADYDHDGLQFVLSYDIGEYTKGELRAPLGEIELELKAGDIDALNALCDQLIRKYGLKVGTQGKYTVAMLLDQPREESEKHEN